MRRRVKFLDHWEGVCYKGNNLIIQKISQGKYDNTLLIIGNGHSVTLDDDDDVIAADPGMREFKPKFNANNVTVYAFYFVSFDASIPKAAKELADFIDQISKDYKKVILVGHSKSGICIEYASNYTKRLVDYCISISAPHAGTISANIYYKIVSFL